MGNCCRTAAVDSQHSPSNTKPSSPVASKYVSNNQNGSSKGNDRSTSPKNKGKEIVKQPVPTEKINVIPSLKIFTFAELKSATRNFRPDTVLGEGGFGRVFKGWIDENTYAPSRVGVGIAVAVKKANSDSSQGLKEWQAEVKVLGKITHPNLVRLLGFCWEEKEFLLVYEYMQKGSLENHLFRKAAEPLPWEVRLNIAIGAARGLDFLHTSEKKVIYRDFKTSNILLDGNYNAKLSDFGLAKLGPADGDSHVTTAVVGTYGYAAPEYVATGHLYIKSDVYGFGVVLLEMLTGLQALDTNRPGGQHNLVEWAKPSLGEKRKLKKIMDPKLEDQYPLKGAHQAAELILKCIESEPKNRPSMNEVLDTLEKVIAIKIKQKETKASPLNPNQHQQSPLHHHYQHNHHHHHRNNNNNHRSPIHPKHGTRSNGGRADQHPSTSRRPS